MRPVLLVWSHPRRPNQEVTSQIRQWGGSFFLFVCLLKVLLLVLYSCFVFTSLLATSMSNVRLSIKLSFIRSYIFFINLNYNFIKKEDKNKQEDKHDRFTRKGEIPRY